MFFDTSHEPGNQLPAGVGDILFGSNGRELSYFSELIDQDSLDRINKDASVNPIFELECFAILMALKLWHTRLCGCHAIIFTDHNGALGSMLKGHAENTVGSTIVHDHSMVITSQLGKQLFRCSFKGRHQWQARSPVFLLRWPSLKLRWGDFPSHADQVAEGE